MDKISGILRTPDGKIFYPRPFYRIGDILESTNPNNPGDDGYIGTWELYGVGKVTVCIDVNDTDFNQVNKTIGEKEHTLTVGEMPAHNHGWYVEGGSNSNYGGKLQAGSTRLDLYSTSNTGGGQAHNNLQPSIVVYRWRRIA